MVADVREDLLLERPKTGDGLEAGRTSCCVAVKTVRSQNFFLGAVAVGTAGRLKVQK